MVLRRTLLVLYIFLIFHIQHNFPTVSSRPSSVDANHETLPISASKPDVVGFEGKAPELPFFINKGFRLPPFRLPPFFRRGGGGSKGGGKGGGSSKGGGTPIPPVPVHGPPVTPVPVHGPPVTPVPVHGPPVTPVIGPPVTPVRGSPVNPVHGAPVIIPGVGGGRSHRSSGSRNTQRGLCVVVSLGFSVLTGLLLV